jgi:hypothetical protein
MTNADVIKMVKAGIPEAVIVSSIQAATKQFDFSPAGIQALQQAHVSPAVLAAMCDGSARCPAIQGNSRPATPASKVELNPQPFPPRMAANGSAGTPGTNVVLNPQPLPPGEKDKSAIPTALKPVRLPVPASLGKRTNPRLAQQNASIIAVLEQQRLASEQEASAMKAGTRAIASAASVRNPALSANLQGYTLQGLGPQTIQSSSKLPSTITHAPAFNTIVLTCSKDATPRILRVSGGEANGIFTPEAKYNLYTIAGCSLGQSQPGNSAFIYGTNGFKANLNIDFWSDNRITAHLDPWLAGVLDQDNVSRFSPRMGWLSGYWGHAAWIHGPGRKTRPA